MNIIVSAGGTGGHINPALALINEFKKQEKNLNVLYIGTHNRMEKDIIPNMNIDYEGIKINGLSKNPITCLKCLTSTLKGIDKCSKIMKKYPQVSKNIKVKNEDKKELFTNDEINNIINKSKDILKDTGRIIVRPSGTEPLIRVMIEGNDLDLINQLLNDIAHVIENKIGIK